MTLQEMGQLIREQRETTGLSIEDVAGRIKVSARTLRAIESGSVEGLPHAVYTKGFVRSFALAVGMPPEELHSRLHQAFPPEAFDDAKPEPGPLVRPLTPSGLGRKIAFLVLLLVMLAGLAAGGWYIVAAYGDEIMKRVKQPFSAVTPLPESGINGTAALTGMPTLDRADLAEVASNSSGRNAAQSPSVLSQEGAAAPLAPAASASSAAQAASAAVKPSPPAQTETPPTPRGETSTATQTVLISARTPCWVGSKADGGAGRQYTVKAGESFTLTFKKSLELVLGNPEGVDILYNGKPYQPAYNPGERARFALP